MAKENSILTAEQEKQLRQPIEDYVGKIQAKLDGLRADGTNRVVELQNDIDSVKKDHIFTQQEKDKEITRLKAELEKAKAVENKNKDEVAKLIADAEGYLKANFDKYYQAVLASCKEEK
ncbi:MAG TPA: galactoside ABC transporter permease, partial [Candidatus Lachnoclostridium stercorigallinarum]|nr:galactoside ABC transporter permease [Candidatus Lachnoclostridium stercorigallinarum]